MWSEPPGATTVPATGGLSSMSSPRRYAATLPRAWMSVGRLSCVSSARRSGGRATTSTCRRWVSARAGPGARDEPVGRRIGIENPYEAPKVLLLDAVAGANRCRAIWSSSFGFVTVLGFAADIAAVELLFTSLLVQATTAMMHAGSRRDAHGRSTTRSFRQ